MIADASHVSETCLQKHNLNPAGIVAGRGIHILKKCEFVLFLKGSQHSGSLCIADFLAIFKRILSHGKTFIFR